jgi:hypothetical protein
MMTGPAGTSQGSHATHRPDNGGGSAIDRPILRSTPAEVPLAELFFYPQACLDADPAIVESDGVATQDGQKCAADSGRQIAGRFSSYKNGSDSCEMAEELLEFYVGKVMKKKVGVNQLCRGGFLRRNQWSQSSSWPRME